MRKTYRELAEEVRMDDKRLCLIAALGNSEDIIYRYHLTYEDWAAGEQLSLESSSNQHGKEGIAFLLEQLRTDESSRQYTDTAYLAAKAPSQLRHRGFYIVLFEELTTLLLAGPGVKEGALRQKRITTLGWVGSTTGIDALIDSLRGDPDALRRA